MLDGVNTATGLLIYNTNAATTGGSGVGYYYFNGTTWERLVTSSSSGDDDWYEEEPPLRPIASTMINLPLETLPLVRIRQIIFGTQSARWYYHKNIEYLF